MAKHNSGQWTKGQSGNPGGRRGAQKARDQLDIVHLAQMHTKSALKCLAEIVKDKEAPHSARANAAATLLDRGYGRAPQTITHKGELENAILGLITGLDSQKAKEEEEHTLQ